MSAPIHSDPPHRSEHLTAARLLGYGLGVAALGVVVVGAASAWGSPAGLARVIVMACLLVLWVGGVGAALTINRYPVARWLEGLAIPWPARFLAATLILLTALVLLWMGLDALRLWGAGAASAVVGQGLVAIVSIGLLLGLWTLAMWRWRFAPAAVAMLFGVHGALAVAVMRGPDALWYAPVWVLCFAVVGWVPARSIRHREGAVDPGPAHYVLVAMLPVVMMALSWLVAAVGR